MERKLAVSMFGQKRLSREGGIEIVAKELCTRMVQNGCTVTCYNRSGHHVSGAEYDNKTEYEGICQKYVPTIEKKGLAAVSSSFFAAFYSAFGKYDVVHIHAEGPAFFAWLPKLFGKKVVVTIHGIDWQREKWKSGFGSKFIRQGEKNAVKYADEIIVLSKGVQDYFKNTYDRDTWFIPNGVNRPEIRKAELITQKFGLTENSYILFLGRLVPEKGIRYLIEAFKNVCTDKKLVIAGGSSDTDSFMKKLQESAKEDDRIIFTGFVQGRMLDELYSNAYIYTLPSDLEGMPLSLLEAMSYGNCCLVSDIPECTEVVEDKACKIVYTTHDYQLVCPSHGMFDVDMKPCERCLDGHYIHCLQTKCLKNSRAKSLLGTLDGYMWKYSKAYSYVDAYICCSYFLKSKLDTQKRFRDKTIGLHNFKKEMPHLDNIQKKGYVLEFGHLSRDKGTDTLLEVAKKMPNTEFVFIGYGPSADKMKDIPNVKYLGFKTGEELYRIIAEAAISVCPSEWYENCPYSVMESVLLGTPVVGSKMGGIPELIEPGKTGELFEAGNVEDLMKAIKKVLQTQDVLERYTKNCSQVKYETTESYYIKLMKIYRGEKNVEQISS